MDNSMKILREVADIYGITVDEMKSPSRLRVFVDARTVACYILRLKGLTYHAIGRLLNRTHSSVFYFNKKADEWKRLPMLNPNGVRAISEIKKSIG